MQASLWNSCARQLENELTEQQFNTWIRPLQAVEEGEVLRLFAPNRFVVDWLQEHFYERIHQLVSAVSGEADTAIVLQVGSRPAAQPETPAAAAPRRPSLPSVGSRLNPGFTFANFVAGKSNQLARAAATQVASNPGKAYNPLFIYGGVGLGKTHLMHSIGNAVMEGNPQARVAYVHSERFVGDMVRALQHNKINEFKRVYRSLDALLIDDIQFFAGKDRTQEEFFHTFNALFDGKQQIILTCDRYPREVEGLEPRLKSRLAWGLSVAIEPPDFETRAQIVLSKASERGARIPEDVAFLIAKKMRSNVRDLEGALNTLAARANFTGRAI
ncbi:MAG: chromosomal replication initiator protein DnaA, partial [Gammaproteobacteria bacterium]